MAVNVKMGVDTSAFKSNIQDATAQLKTFDAQLKNAEATMKATGNAEQGLTQKMNALTGKLETQKRMAQQYAQQLEKMRTAGVDPLSKEYQKLAAALLNADTGIKETQAQLDNLTTSENKAADGADKLTQSVNSISRKVSLDQVISGINSITSGLENAAKKAVDLGEKLWNTIMDSASRADDTATMAEMYGFDIETFQKMQKLVTDGMDTTVKNMLDAQDKLKRGIGSGSKTVLDYLKELKVGLREGNLEDPFSWKTKDPQKMFWDVGQALMAMGEAYDKEAAATALFGKSWKELNSLFSTYPTLEAYNAALEEQTVNDEQTIRDLAALNDAVGKLESSWTTLKDELIGAIAPALTGAADAVSGLLDKLTKYLKTDAGQEMLTNLGNAVSTLFEDLGKIDPEKVVENFAKLFEGVINSFTWLTEHWNDVKVALIGIAGGFGVLKIATLALNIAKVVSGLGGLLSGGNGGGGGGGGGTPTVTGTDTGTTKTGVPWLTRFLNTAVQGTQTSWLMDFAFDQRGKWFGIDTSGTNVETAKQFIKANNIIGEYAEQNLQLAQFIDGLEKETDSVQVADVDTRKVIPYGTYKKMQKAKDSDTTDHSGRIYFGDVQGFEMGEDVDISTLLDASDGAEEIQEQVGTVTIPVKLSVSGIGGGFFGGTNGKLWESMFDLFNITGHANGLAYVPNNGLYRLHRGEQVLPAREVASRNYSSNLYVESMYMNNGQDAEGLASAMAAAQRRTMNGYGS